MADSAEEESSDGTGNKSGSFAAVLEGKSLHTFFENIYLLQCVLIIAYWI